MAKTLITPQTGAATSDAIDINVQRPVTQAGFDNGNFTTGTTFRVTGATLGAGEYVTLNYGTTASPIPVNEEGDNGKKLDENNTVCTIYGRLTGVFVTKSVTASAVGVEVV
jgi:hypothetical protein